MIGDMDEFTGRDPGYYDPATKEELEAYCAMSPEQKKAKNFSIHELCRLAIREGIENDAWRRSIRQSLRRTLGLPPFPDSPEEPIRSDSQ